MLWLDRKRILCIKFNHKYGFLIFFCEICIIITGLLTYKILITHFAR